MLQTSATLIKGVNSSKANTLFIFTDDFSIANFLIQKKFITPRCLQRER
ncbi:hypothetical protein O59_000936 [Cellvibrio sp. BR]|nr:hypothetical protein O59_000936 [Cellvibrio sp. BR]